LKTFLKILACAAVFYSLLAGLLGEVPRLAILNETIRNIYFHVPMWFTMMALFLVSVIYSIRYLSGFSLANDDVAAVAASTGMVFGLCGLITGMLWARFTWGAWWVADTKLNGSAATMLMYTAYFILRQSVREPQARARLAAVYGIFAFALMVVFIMVLPRLTDSLHPGSGGNPAFSSYDLDRRMRWVFYPAVAGWIGVGLWIMDVRLRMRRVEAKLINNGYS
jgi:heme exporter protein C